MLLYCFIKFLLPFRLAWIYHLRKIQAFKQPAILNMSVVRNEKENEKENVQVYVIVSKVL